jgi:hypothetical protein
VTKEQFLKRCATAWDMDLITELRMDLVEKCLDFVMRLEHTLFSNGQTHGSSAWDFLEGEKKRIGTRSLAGDTDLYAAIQFAAILSHPCTEAGTDMKTDMDMDADTKMEAETDAEHRARQGQMMNSIRNIKPFYHESVKPCAHLRR